MRELKFRAWVNDGYMAIQGTPDLETFQSFMFHYCNEKILMQFTGLKDKKGIDIYEGDVVNLSIEGFNLKPHLVPFLIVFNIDGFQGCNLLKKKSDFLNGTFFQQPRRFNYKEWKKLEVIGNIYENPELLISNS